MKGALLALKYKDLKLGHQYAPSALKNLGWNIRKKYLRHAEDEKTKTALSTFADLAIDDQIVDFDTLPVVNEALLQAQRWRYDKEAFSIDPPHEQAWDRAEGMIAISETNPAIIFKYLTDKKFDISSFQKNQLQSIFLKLALAEILQSVVGDQLCELWSIDCSEPDHTFLSHLSQLSSKCGELSALSDAQDIFEALEMFGFPEISKINNLPDSSEISTTQFFGVTFSEMSLPPNKLFDLCHFEGGINVKLNSNNKCVQHALKNEDIKSFFEEILRAYVSSLENMQAHSPLLDDFTSYFALFLDREFSDPLAANHK